MAAGCYIDAKVPLASFEVLRLLRPSLEVLRVGVDAQRLVIAQHP